MDWWAFGVILYQMVTSQAPFRGEDEDEIYDSILSDNQPYYPENMPDDAVDLIRKLLERNPEERLGYRRGAQEVMEHPFFDSIEWDALYKKEVVPPFKPTLRDKNDLSNFDVEFTREAPVLTTGQPGMPTLSQSGGVLLC